MSSDWLNLTFGDFVSIQRGHDLPDQHRRKGSVPILGSFGITGYHDTAKTKGPGVTVGRSGASFGVAAYSGVDFWPLNTALYVTDFKGNDPKFVFYFMKAFDFSSYNSGSAQPSLNRNNLYPTLVKIPQPREQKQIASLLIALDDRIALLRETNTTLESIAQALFKSWFVDFDPVRAKQEGREPEGMDADTAALFPDSFEESELGLVPKGWRVGKVETVLSRLPAKVRYTKDQISSDGGTPVYEQGAGILLGYHEGNAQYQANENDPAFIFGDHTCVTHLSCEPFDISQNVIPLKGKDRATLWVYYAIKDKQTFQEYRRHWMELIVKDIVIPTAQVCDAFAKYVSSYHLKMESNVHHSRTLATLRDTLLPRLISGQLRLPDAEATCRLG